MKSFTELREKKSESGIEVARRIVKNGQYEKVKGVVIDGTTANLIMQIYDKVKPEIKKKMEQQDIVKLAHASWSIMGKK